MTYSTLGAVGHGMRLGEEDDLRRQQARMGDLAERRAADAGMRERMLPEIVRRAYEFAKQQEEDEAKPSKKAAVPALAPLPQFAPLPDTRGFSQDDMMLLRGAETGGLAMADGGEVKKKYDGVYDDIKSEGRLPRVFHEYLSDMQQPGFRHGAGSKQVMQALQGMVGGAAKFAEGGLVNGVNMPVGFADGGEVTHENLKTVLDQYFGKQKGAVKMRRGGAVRGPGTGTSDSIPARLSDGEYVLSADTVRAVGIDKLDALQARFHKRVR